MFNPQTAINGDSDVLYNSALKPVMQLPFEIWQYIALFIPTETLRTLPSVNRAFVELSMEARYKAMLFGFSDGDVSKNFINLENPAIALRVRWIYLRPAVFLKNSAGSVGGDKCVITRADSNSISLVSSERKALEQMTSAFGAITGLKELYLHCWPTNDTDILISSIPFIRAAFTCFGTTLRELTLDGSLEALSHALEPSLVFKSLERLSIRFVKSNKLPHVVTTLRDTVAPFINNHQSTLRTFELAPPDLTIAKVDFGVTALFGMSYFPHLTKIIIQIALNEPETLALTRLIGLHKAQISHLEISSEHSPRFYDGEPPTSLKYLALAKPSHFSGYENLIGFLKISGSRLIILELTNYQIGYHPAVFDALSQCEMLQELIIRANFPNSCFFDLLAEKLPNLHAVNLAVHRESLSRCSLSMRSLFGYDTSWRYPPGTKLRRLRIRIPHPPKPNAVAECQTNFRAMFPGIHCTLESFSDGSRFGLSTIRTLRRRPS